MKNSKKSLKNLTQKLQQLQPEEMERARDSDLLNLITKKIGKRHSLWTKRILMKDQSLLNHPLDTEERMQKIPTNQEEEPTEEAQEEAQGEVPQEEEAPQEEIPQEEILQEELTEEAKAQLKDHHLETTAPTITETIIEEMIEELILLSTLRTCLLNWMKLI